MTFLKLCLVLVSVCLITPTGAARAHTARPDSIPMMKVPSQMPELPPIIIKGKEFTVRELVKRAMKGERSKLAGHADATYLITSHVSIVWSEKKEVETQVTRVYGDSTGTTRRVLLAAKAQRFKKREGEWVYDKDVDAHDDGYRITDYDEGRFTTIPVYLEHDEEFDFEFIDRTLETDRVVFHVRFKPKSDFSEMPRGEIWIDGDGFRVVHEIYDFTTNPFPMLIKGVRRISVQWTELPGGEWVPRQIAAEIDIRKAPLMPTSISFKQIWEDFRFDLGYDERLFGKRDREPVAIAAKPVPAPETTRAIGPPDTALVDSSGVSAVVPDSLYMNEGDSTSAGGPRLLAMLQQQDDAAYSSEVRITDHAFIDSTLALHDSAGVAGLGDDIALYGSEWQLGLDPRLSRWNYNRVEGFVFGGEASFHRADDRNRLSAFGAYATASEKFRYRADFDAELPKTDRKLSLRLSFRDYVEPFGSNRITLNSLRAFVGGADDQDYLHRVGGAARLVLTPWDDVSFDIGFEGARERSAATDADFSLWGDLGRPNPAVDEGDEHAVAARFELSGRRWLNARVTQRLAGGSLGGDFRYARTDVTLSARGFPIGRQEFELTLKGVTTGDSPPFQQLADIGGLSTVRGYGPRTHVGNHSFAARLEYLFPYNVFASSRIPLLEDAGIQLIPWADVGRVGEGDSPDWITSVGFGFQRYLWPFDNAANLRLDFAWPLDHPEDDFAVYLWFVGLR
jgi:hypothetical protein